MIWQQNVDIRTYGKDSEGERESVPETERVKCNQTIKQSNFRSAGG